ncbi:UPF0149 family protein [Marinobacter caseinilyticus]|uniref:UPF0149 family protein n=1 Tax=Marinobacter caseinilyticus TaxID=2692195 RepID=UPI00140C4AE3|nr:UPF0149 family protein [Marinobacter caseinilyticus]
MRHIDDVDVDPTGFESWANVYTVHKAFSHPSELHGSLCGRLTAGKRMDEDAWMTIVCEHMGLATSVADESPELASFMSGAYDRALVQLNAADMSFKPLLPDDEYALDQRLQALSAWVRGFLEGMALVASESLGQAPEEIRELIEDFVAISQVAESEEDSDEGEYQFTEITEYVRLGALAVFTEFNEPVKAPAGENTLH